MIHNTNQYTQKDNNPQAESPNQAKFSFAILPYYILDDKNIEDGAKLLYARISNMAQEGRCWATNEYFMKKHDVCLRTIQNWLKQLVDHGYLIIEIEKGSFNTKRNIWLNEQFKKQFTKCNTMHEGVQQNAPRGATECTHNIDLDITNGGGARASVPETSKSSYRKIEYLDLKGKKSSVLESDIFNHFLRSQPSVATEIIQQAIDVLLKQSEPIRDVFKYLEAIVQRLMVKPSSTKKEKKPKIVNDDSHVKYYGPETYKVGIFI